MKPNLLLLHGALGSATQFESLARELENEFIIHRFNLSGHGSNNSINPFSIQQFAQDLKNYFEENQLSQVNVFGYSMGGYVALTLAANSPHYFSKIITLGTKYEWTQESADKEAALMDPIKIETKVPAFAAALSSLHGYERWKEVVQKTADLMRSMGSGDKTDDNTFGQVNVPCIIGIGDQDKMVSLEETKKLQTLIRSAALEILPNTIHPLEKIQTSTLLNYIRKYLL
ncbi:MAG: alpha/beta fold hydrolase [Crocinitomicaceae bacterium]|nr:alpha/beta fold hydrolase [Crocinitomicaceae bacterium]MBK8926848.1 alpha/beta fold hydrolase [Crocinitomicaceae bacterium]